MKMTKQLRDGIILGVGLLILIIVAVVTLKGSNPSATPPSTKKKADANAGQTAAQTTVAASPGGVDWIDADRLPGIVGEVDGGRNPFRDLMAPIPVPVPRGPDKALANVNKSDGALPAGGFQQVAPLKYIGWQELDAKLKKEGLNVAVSPGPRAGTVRLSGVEMDVRDAIAMLPELDTMPALGFVLVGVITSASKRYAIFTTQNGTFSLYEGETVPALGWKIVKITSTGVTLKKGTLNHTIRLAGGNAS